MTRRTSSFLTLLILALSVGRGAFAEGLPDPALDALRAQEAQREEERIQREMENPQSPPVAKDRVGIGPKGAPILIVVYSDFQCPYCQRGADTVEAVRKKYGKKVRYVFKHLPLPMHPQALPAAQYFEAIGMQSPEKAYKFHDEVFAHQSRLGSEGAKYFDEVAEKLKVNMKRLKKDIESPLVHNHIQADGEEARGFGMTGTPGFNVAGVTLKGAYPIEYFERIIDHRLTKRASASKKSS